MLKICDIFTFSPTLKKNHEAQVKRRKDELDKNKKKIKIYRHLPENLPAIAMDRHQEDSDDDNSNFAEHSGLSEYEKMVRKNREEKFAFLQSLKISETKSDFKEAVSGLIANIEPRKTVKVKHSVEKRPTKKLPPRRSLRLSKVNIDLSEEAVAAKALAEASAANEDVQPLPRNMAFEEALNGKQLYSYFIDDFSDLKVEEQQCRYEDNFKTMKIDQNHVAKIVNGRVTAMALHPCSDKIIVCAGSKYGTLGLWNTASNCAPYEFTPHLQNITCVQFNPYQTHQIVSSSYDGILRCGDFEKMQFREVYNISDETSCTSFDFFSQHTFLVGQKDGKIAIVDARTENKRFEKKHQCHDHPVKSISVHPLEKSYFFTASNRGSMCLWDLRKLQKQSLIQIENHHQRSVNSAFFSPKSGNSILTTSADDSICIFDSSNLSTDITLKKSMKHNNFTGRWLTVFRATWLPDSDDNFVVGSMLSPRRIEVYNKNMNNIHNFTDENLNCITSVNVFHPSLPILAGANSSGKVYIFTKSD